MDTLSVPSSGSCHKSQMVCKAREGLNVTVPIEDTSPKLCIYQTPTERLLSALHINNQLPALSLIRKGG